MFGIFGYDFMLRAFAAGLVVAIIAPTIGMFLVARRYALIADTLSHVALAGIAVGVLLNTAPIITATITTVIIAIVIERLRSRHIVSGDSALALFLSGSLAIASVLLSFAKNAAPSLFGLLFGSVTTVRSSDLVSITILGAIVLISVILLYRQLFLVSYDEDFARVTGVPVKRLNLILVILTAITVTIAMRIVGVLLISALMITPVLTAMQLKLSFYKTLLSSIIIAIITVSGGLFASFYLDIAAGGIIVVIALIFFGLSLALKP